MSGLDREGCAIEPDGRGKVSLLVLSAIRSVQRLADCDPGPLACDWELERCGQLADGFVDTALLDQRQAEIAAGRGIVAGDGQRVFQQRDPVAPVTNL